VHIEEAFTAYLLAYPGLTALIGRRFMFDYLPQDTVLPAVVWQCVSDVKEHTHQGQIANESPTYQFTVYAATRAAARAVAEQIKLALCDYVGDMGGASVEWVKQINELPTTETNTDGTIKVHAIDLEFEFNYIKE